MALLLRPFNRKQQLYIILLNGLLMLHNIKKMVFRNERKNIKAYLAGNLFGIGIWICDNFCMSKKGGYMNSAKEVAEGKHWINRFI